MIFKNKCQSLLFLFIFFNNFITGLSNPLCVVNFFLEGEMGEIVYDKPFKAHDRKKNFQFSVKSEVILK